MDLTPFDTLWLAAAVRLAVPVALAALGELVSERAGVLNIGLEGMMLAGAFFSFWAAKETGNLLVGAVGGVCAGAALSALMAGLSIYARADQIIVGVGINILALGLTTVAFRAISPGEAAVRIENMEPLAVPVLSSIPTVGDVLFRQIPLVYVLYVFLPVTWFLLYRTTWGLSIRASGETPVAADTAGISIHRVRSVAVLIAGGAAGLAGAFLSIGQLGTFVEGMSGGRGFLALAAVIFSGWRPLRVIGAAFVFGGADALQLRLQGDEVPRVVWLVVLLVLVAGLLLGLHGRAKRAKAKPRQAARFRADAGVLVALAAIVVVGTVFWLAPAWEIPSQLWLALPYLLSLVVLAVASGRGRMPSALGIPYSRAD